MLRAHEYAFATPQHLGSTTYKDFCAHAGLDPRPDGYGMVLCSDESDRHWTIAGDVEFTRALVVDSEHPGLPVNLVIPDEEYHLMREGWPDEWSGKGSFVRNPHDRTTTGADQVEQTAVIPRIVGISGDFLQIDGQRVVRVVAGQPGGPSSAPFRVFKIVERDL